MATKKKIAQAPKSTKRPARKREEQPLPEGLVERAAARAGVKPSAHKPEAPGLTPDDEAALAALKVAMGRRSPTVVAHLEALRRQHVPNDAIRFHLRSEAHDLEYVAERLTPEPETRDEMLRDALEIVSAAADIFYVDGEFGGSADAIMREALRSAEQEFDLFCAMKESRGSDLHWQELWRASYRAKLARKLAEFRAKHPEWKPLKADASDETEGSEPAKVAS